MTYFSAFWYSTSSSREALRLLDEAVPGHVDVDVHRQRAVDGLHPFRRIGGAHRRKHAVEVRLAHEQDLLLGQIDHQVAAGVRAAEEQHLRLHAADVDDLLVAGHRRRRHDHDAWSRRGASRRGLRRRFLVCGFGLGRSHARAARATSGGRCR